MITTIDRGGRVVIPKALRDELGLRPGDAIDVSSDGTSIRVGRVQAADPPLRRRHGRPAIDAAVTLTDDDLRSLRLDVQR